MRILMLAPQPFFEPRGTPISVYQRLEARSSLGHEMEGASIVRARNSRALFVLVDGKPDQINQFRAIARRERVEDCVVFIGIVPRDEALTFLDVADVLMSPRRGGACVPLKIYRCLCSSTARVATRVSAHAGVLNDEIARLAEPDNEALAEDILSLLDNRQMSQQVGRRARQHALEHHDAGEYTARLEQIFGTLRSVDPEMTRSTGQLEKSEILCAASVAMCGLVGTDRYWPANLAAHD